MTFSSAFVYQKLKTLKEHTTELKEFLEQTSDKEFFSNLGKLQQKSY